MSGPTRTPAVRIPGYKRGGPHPSFQSHAGLSTHSAHVHTPRRSSSVYSRATRCWDEVPNWSSSSAMPPVPALPLAGNPQFAESSPELSSPDVSPSRPEVQEKLPPLFDSLDPKGFGLSALSDPSSSRPLRERASLTISVLLSDEVDTGSNRSPRTERIRPPPSPPSMTPMFSHKYSLSDGTYSDTPVGYAHHQRSNSAESRLAATLSAPFEGPQSEIYWRNSSIDPAFSHMRLGSDVGGVDYGEHVLAGLLAGAESQSRIPQDVMSSDYRDRLIDEYKILTPSEVLSQVDRTDSDLESTGHELRLVPTPLFWENRQKEIYPQRTIYAQQRMDGRGSKSSMRRKSIEEHMNRISPSKAPLQMISPSQHKRRSNEEQDDSPTTTALKHALALRLRSKKPDDPDHANTSSAPRLFHGKPISRPIQDGPLPLQLPKLACGEIEAKKPGIHQPTLDRAKTSYTLRTNGGSISGVNPPKRSSRRKEKQVGIPGKSDGDPNGASYTSRIMNHLPSPRRLPQSPIHAHFFRKALSSTGNDSAFREDHDHDHVGDNGHYFQGRLISAFSPIDGDRRSIRPAIFDKALDTLRERNRDKRRKDLKSQIKFVGKVDPNKIYQDLENKRRETSGEVQNLV